MRLLGRWFGRGLAFSVCSASLIVAVACGDDDGSSPTDAGIDQNVIQPPPPDLRDAAKPPEGIDRTGVLGTAQLVASIGENVDGPSWSATEGVLYFAVPGSADSLRKLAPDGGVSSVAYDAGPAYGTASGGTNRIFVTDKNGITMFDVPDGGTASGGTRRSGAFTLLGDIAADRQPDASVHAYVCDTTDGRAYHFNPNGGVKEFTTVFGPSDGGGVGLGVGSRATGIAVGRRGSSSTVWVALASDARGTVYEIEEDTPGFQREIALNATPPNAIAVDEQNLLYVAWAQGIDVYGPANQPMGASPGLALAAAPTSLTFGGADRKTLYVTTAAGKIYAIPTKNPGVLR